MKISFFRGDHHEVKFKFTKYTGTPEKIYLTVKCGCKIKRLQKKLNDGIEYKDGWYVITFKPEDTNNLSCALNMVYDIEIIVDGKPYTVAKNEFEITEDVTTPDDEV